MAFGPSTMMSPVSITSCVVAQPQTASSAKSSQPLEKNLVAYGKVGDQFPQNRRLMPLLMGSKLTQNSNHNLVGAKKKKLQSAPPFPEKQPDLHSPATL